MGYNYQMIRADFEILLEQLNVLQKEKIGKYGLIRYNLEDPVDSRMLCWSDIFRKRIRVEPMLKYGFIRSDPLNDEAAGETEWKKELRQNLMDTASYCLMAIQIGEREGWL
jgi:hypothetical protein